MISLEKECAVPTELVNVTFIGNILVVTTLEFVEEALVKTTVCTVSAKSYRRE